MTTTATTPTTAEHEWATANPDHAARLAREVLRQREATMVPYLIASLAEPDGFPAPHSTIIQELAAAVRQQIGYEATGDLPANFQPPKSSVERWAKANRDLAVDIADDVIVAMFPGTPKNLRRTLAEWLARAIWDETGNLRIREGELYRETWNRCLRQMLGNSEPPAAAEEPFLDHDPERWDGQS